MNRYICCLFGYAHSFLRWKRKLPYLSANLDKLFGDMFQDEKDKSPPPVSVDCFSFLLNGFENLSGSFFYRSNPEYEVISFHAGFHISGNNCGHGNRQSEVSNVVSDPFQVINLVGFGCVISFAYSPATGACYGCYGCQMPVVLLSENT